MFGQNNGRIQMINVRQMNPIFIQSHFYKHETVQRRLLASLKERKIAGRRDVRPLVPLAPAHSFVLCVPVVLLTFDGTIAGVPTAMIHGFFFTIVTL